MGVRHSASKDYIAGRPLVPGEAPLDKKNSNFSSWKPVTEIDDRDAKCADNWVPRHPDLIRLTGKHPFNSEPPHADVMKEGWLTPVSMHFVRNHGAVPRLEWGSHRITITGLVERPMEITMDDIAKLPAVTVPCLLTCCGNRRKEVNMVKNSQGFSWGPGAVSVNNWTGARLSDVLKLVGVKSQAQGAKYVHFCGPKGELPKGVDGSYGTALTLGHALDPSMDVLIAYKQNGQFLHPDHGFPCRMLIPGWIGGRSVKWLSHLHVSDKDSQNWYHFHDNKVLPPHVDAESAAKQGWWKDPSFILKELNINSTISSPGHDERILMDQNRRYTMKGYAYSGGGRKIVRVEVSFNGGETWSHPAKIIVTETPNQAGKHWTWVHWELPVDTSQFFTATEVVCRAWDESQNTQPAVLTWTLLGQGNNSMFRLRLHKEVDPQGRLCIRFQQPAPILPGPLGNVGWREQEAGSAVPSAPAAVAAAAPGLDSTKKYVTKAMLEQHVEEASVWFAYKGKVYDGTKFLDDHPGGADSILMAGGEDATEDFDAVHSDSAKKQLEQFYIAELAPEGVPVPANLLYGGVDAAVVVMPGTAAAPLPAIDVDAPFLNPKKQKAAELKEKIKISHDVTLFRFGLEHDEQLLGLPTGKHMLIRKKVTNAEGDEEVVMRAYTPTTANETRGHFDLVVKIYKANVHPKFPEGGKFSQILEALEVGDTVEVKGPIGHFHYDRPGHYKNHKLESEVKRINMIAGGTGLTPMYQVMKAILSNPSDLTEIRLLYANQTEADILLRPELEALAKSHPDRVKIHYTVDRPTPGWKYSSGFIDLDMCERALFRYEPGTISVLCGPPPMLKFACHPNLEKMGFEKGVTSIEF
uniref:Nitrate reductase [NADH] n=1 Tax=Ulva prolifera TaxID=3117 RepID=NIA_ULVPR|nr:RecName: Full=Nitrate reductase [NADH]; Short=NR [Ulva prolifera]ASV49153.1 nitrate reductase [Ulva prolifera]ASV49154.1 nitrate reductase [Ulva prolifera]